MTPEPPQGDAEETAAPERHAAEPTAPVRDPRPSWTYFLSPIALVIGSIIISGTIWYTRDSDDGGSSPAVIATQPASSSAQEAPVSAAKDLLTAFSGYAKQVGIDEAKFNQCLTNDASVKPKIALIEKQLQRGSALGINGTPTFVINNKMVVGAQPGVIFEEIIDKELKGGATTVQEYSANIQALAAANPPRFQILPNKVDVSDATIEGDANAKVMIAEFSDFQCPFCKRWNDENLKMIRSKLGKDVALAFLHFPITQIHPNAGNASIAAICAGEQGKFWEMHDLLFSRQTEWQNLRTN